MKQIASNFNIWRNDEVKNLLLVCKKLAKWEYLKILQILIAH